VESSRKESPIETKATLGDGGENPKKTGINAENQNVRTMGGDFRPDHRGTTKKRESMIRRSDHRVRKI